MNFIINRSKEGAQWDPPPLHKTMFYRILIRFIKQQGHRRDMALEARTGEGLSRSSAGLNPGFSHDRQGLNH